MARNVSAKTAHYLLSIFWPEFKEENDLILLAWEKSPLPKGKDLDHTDVEAFLNHTHIIDIVSHNAQREPTSEEDDQFYDYEHPDFHVMCDIGKRMALLWFQKLKLDFPQYRFRVYYTQYDNPIVRFHKVRQDESYWLDEEDWATDIEKGNIIIYDTEA